MNGKRGPKRADIHRVLLAQYMNFNLVEQTVWEKVDSKITFCVYSTVELRYWNFENVHNLGEQGCTNLNTCVCESLRNFIIFHVLLTVHHSVSV
jgi:hypothetical protein